MKNIIQLSIACLVFLISSNIFGQYTLDWQQNASQDAKKSVMSAIDTQNNIVVTGYLQSYRMYTRKYDIAGTLLWEVEDASGTQSIYEKPNWVNCDAENNVLVVGNQYAISSSYDYPSAIVAIKYSPTGTLLWKTVIPVSVLINSTTSFDCRSVVDANGNLYIGTAIVGGVYLYKIDANGNLIFSNSSAINAPKNFNGMRIKNNKIAVVTSSGTPNVAPVFVWNTDGTLLWTANAVGTLAADVEIDENENVYVLSSLYHQVNPITWDYDAQLTKYDSAGNFLWDYTYDFGGYNFVTRMTYENNRISAIGYGNASGLKWVTFQTNADGALLWATPYTVPVNPTSSDEYPHYVTAKPTGEVIVTGVGSPTPDPFNSSFNQMPIVQYSNTGVQNWVSTPNIYAGTGLASVLASDGSLYAIGSRNMYVFHYNADALSINENTISSKTIVAPNPFLDKVSIVLDEINGPTTAAIFDVTGKILLSVDLQKAPSEVDLSSLQSGIYFCQLKSATKTETVKIIKK